MPTFEQILAKNAEAGSTPFFKAGMGAAKSVFDHGARAWTSEIDVQFYEGSSYDMPMEVSIAEGSAMAPADTTTVIATNGEDTKVMVPERVMHRDVKSSLKAQKYNSGNGIDQRRRNIQRNGKALGKELVRQNILGTGQGPLRQHGLSHWLTAYAGQHAADGTVTFPFDTAEVTYPKLSSQKYFVGGTPGANPVALSQRKLNDFHTRCGDEQFPNVFCTKDAFLSIEEIIENQPGNTAEWIVDDTYNIVTVKYKGVKYTRLDALNEPKVSSNFSTSADGLTLTFNDAAEKSGRSTVAAEAFEGFDDLDIGATVRVTVGGNTQVREIADITSWKVVTLDTALTGAFVSASASISVDITPRAYGVRFGEYGVHLAAGGGNIDSDGIAEIDFDETYSRIAGVELTNMGRLKEGGRFHMDHLDAYLNLAVCGPSAVAVMTGFSAIEQ